MRQDDGWQQQRVPRLRPARLQVLQRVVDIRRRCPLDIPRRYPRVERVREHDLPPPCLALLTDVRLAEDDLCADD